MDFELLVRYMIPGVILLSPLALLRADAVGTGLGGFGATAAMATIPVGFLIHQLWMTIFARRGGYASDRMRNLAYLIDDYHRRTGHRAPLVQAYFAWQHWVYSKAVEEGHRRQARRFWQIYHGSVAGVFASGGALLLTLGLSLWGPLTGPPAIVASVAYFCIGTLLWSRANAVGREVADWELMMAVVDLGSGDEASHLVKGMAKFLRVRESMEGSVAAQSADSESA